MSKKSKKPKTNKLPKKIAGVKVPKELRNTGGMLAKLARDPAAQEVALAALTAALAARKETRQAARSAVAEAGEVAEKSGRAASWVGPALTAAAVEAGRLLLDAYDNGQKRGGAASGAGAAAQAAETPTAIDAGKKVPQSVTH